MTEQENNEGLEFKSPHRINYNSLERDSRQELGLGELKRTEQEALLEKLRDANHLPKLEEIHAAFGKNLSGFMEFCFADEQPVYEFINDEYVKALSDYFTQRFTGLRVLSDKPITILEVGAGDGRLSHFLRQKLEQTGDRLVRVVASDAHLSKETNPYNVEPLFPVEHMSFEDALKRFNPDIVLSSWMPYMDDWTPAFRASDTVKEYILIGEADGGCVGSDETWGMPPFDEDWNPVADYVPAFELEGFSKVYLDDLREYQLCRTDFAGYKHSSTVSFRRTMKLGTESDV